MKKKKSKILSKVEVVGRTQHEKWRKSTGKQKSIETPEPKLLYCMYFLKSFDSVTCSSFNICHEHNEMCCSVNSGEVEGENRSYSVFSLLS